MSATWAPRPTLDDVPACTCQGKYGHHWDCPAKGAVEARRKAIESWDKSAKARERASNKLSGLSTAKGWRAEWRKLQREIGRVPVLPYDTAIQCPVSRYLLTMGERPAYIQVEAPSKGRVIGELRKYESHPQTATLGGPCACDACAAWVTYRLGGSANSGASTGAWTCGCEIYGLGSCRVGVDGSVMVEVVKACARHQGAFYGPAVEAGPQAEIHERRAAL